MRTIIMLTSGAIISSLLLGCNSVNNMAQTSTNVVGNGVQYGAHAVGAGVGLIANTGAFVGKGVTSVVGTGVGVVTGNHYNKHPNGPMYKKINGHYVRVQ